MSFPLQTPSDLATYSGVPLETLTPFAVEAIAQATLLFMVVTELQDPPTDATDLQLANKGIIAMADTIYLEQPYREIKAAPINDLALGSAHVSKAPQYIRGSAAANALRGEETGVMWWDLAVQTLALRTRRGGVFGGSMEVRAAFPDLTVEVCPITGQKRVLGPAETDTLGFPFDFNIDQPGGTNELSGGL